MGLLAQGSAALAACASLTETPEHPIIVAKDREQGGAHRCPRKRIGSSPALRPTFFFFFFFNYIRAKEGPLDQKKIPFRAKDGKSGYVSSWMPRVALPARHSKRKVGERRARRAADSSGM